MGVDDVKEKPRERSRRDRTSPSRDRDRSAERSDRKRNTTNRVYVSNICYEYRWQDLKDLFRTHVGDVSYVELFEDETGKPRGCGIVEFADPSLVKKCLEVMHRFELKGRKLVVKEDYGNERDRCGHIISGKSRDRMRDDFDTPPSSKDFKWGNTFGLSPQFLESLGINSPLVNKVFVANLDYKVDEKKLREVFKLAGKVMDIELYTDKDGNSRGFAVVEFEHPVESVQAISMFHNQQLFDRKMTVRIDRASDRPEGSFKLPEGLKGIGMGLGMNGEPLRDVKNNLSSFQLSSNMPSCGMLNAFSTHASGLNAIANATPNLAGTAGVNIQALSGVNALQNTLLNNIGNTDLATLATTALGNSNVNSFLQSSSLPAVPPNNLHFGRQETHPGFSSSKGPNNLGSASTSHSQQEFVRDYDSVMKGYTVKSENEFQQSNPVYTSTNNGSQARSLQNLQKPNYSNTIVVSNLPLSSSWKLLREKFQQFGDIQYVDMKTSDTGIVKFSSEWEAERAIKVMDRTRIDGRAIDVRFY